MFQLCKNDPVESGIPWTKLITDQFKINGLLRRLSLEHITEMGRRGNSGGNWEPSSQQVFVLAASFWFFYRTLNSLLRIPQISRTSCRLRDLSADL